jgi:hypothetical protein
VSQLWHKKRIAKWITFSFIGIRKEGAKQLFSYAYEWKERILEITIYPQCLNYDIRKELPSESPFVGGTLLAFLNAE